MSPQPTPRSTSLSRAPRPAGPAPAADVPPDPVVPEPVAPAPRPAPVAVAPPPDPLAVMPLITQPRESVSRTQKSVKIRSEILAEAEKHRARRNIGFQDVVDEALAMWSAAMRGR